jgi:hypothetical protein
MIDRGHELAGLPPEEWRVEIRRHAAMPMLTVLMSARASTGVR